MQKLRIHRHCYYQQHQLQNFQRKTWQRQRGWAKAVQKLQTEMGGGGGQGTVASVAREKPRVSQSLRPAARVGSNDHTKD